MSNALAKDRWELLMTVRQTVIHRDDDWIDSEWEVQSCEEAIY